MHLKSLKPMSWETKVAAPDRGDSSTVCKHLQHPGAQFGCQLRAGSTGVLKGTAYSKESPAQSRPTVPNTSAASTLSHVSTESPPSLQEHSKRPELVMCSEICCPSDMSICPTSCHHSELRGNSSLGGRRTHERLPSSLHTQYGGPRICHYPQGSGFWSRSFLAWRQCRDGAADPGTFPPHLREHAWILKLPAKYQLCRC